MYISISPYSKPGLIFFLYYQMGSRVYIKEFPIYGLKSCILTETYDMQNKCYDYTIIKRKGGHLRRLVTVPFEVMIVMLNRIKHAMESLRHEREWISRMALNSLSGKFYQLFCITIYVHGAREWGVSANLRVSDRRVYIGLHEMKAHADSGPKTVYPHYEALFELIDSLDQANTEVARHPGTYKPIGGAAISISSFEHSVRAALAHDSLY